MIPRVVWRVGSPAALDFWSERLAGAGVETTGEGDSLRSRIRRASSTTAGGPGAGRAADAEHPEVPRARLGLPPRAHATPSAAAACSSRASAPRIGRRLKEAPRRRARRALPPTPRRGAQNQGAGAVRHIAWNSADEDHGRGATALAQSGAPHAGDRQELLQV